MINDSNRMTIKAVDWTYQRGAFELVGEYAHASIERDGSFQGDWRLPIAIHYNGDMLGLLYRTKIPLHAAVP